jgi:hypothetical protein
VSAGAKLCYAALTRYAGQDGRCFPRQKLLAAELGVSERQVRRYLRELEQAGLLRTTRRGLNDPNSYTFLWHSIFEDAKPLNPQGRTCPSDPFKEEDSGKG